MAKRIPWTKQLMDDFMDMVNIHRENASRQIVEGYMKPLCAPDQHKPFRHSTRCEACGLIIRGSGAKTALPTNQQ